MLAAKTLSPGSLVTGWLSPVIGAWFTSDVPSTTTPSVAIAVARPDEENDPRPPDPRTAISSAWSSRWTSAVFGRKVHERVNRRPGLPLGEILRRLGDRSEEDENLPLLGMADEGRDDRRGAHQEIEAHLRCEDQVGDGLAAEVEARRGSPRVRTPG